LPDPQPPAKQATPTRRHPVVLFDGVCGLCNRSVDYIIRHDRRGVFRFAPLQSGYGQQLLEQAGLDAASLDSLVLSDAQGHAVRSEAVLRIAEHLGPVHRVLARLGRLVPRGLRDRLYRLIARHRYRWFGKREACGMPSPEERERFIMQPPED